jgi:hypothetical protein
MNYIIVSSHGEYVSKLLLACKDDAEIRVLTADQAVANKIVITAKDKIYFSSDTIFNKIKFILDEDKIVIIEELRNKYEFRKKIAPLFPDFYFEKINLAALTKCKLDFDLHERYFIKPLTGFMGGCARVVERNTDLPKLVAAIENELLKFSQLYPNLFANEFLIEQYIGDLDEYAVDMFYDASGKPVIINIYCHPVARRVEYLQMLYYTSKQIFDQYHEKVRHFFNDFNQDLAVKSFPIHAEFRLNKEGDLIPIEFNPGRFGGMGLADLTYYAFNFHPVKAYFADTKPNWQEILAVNSNRIFCWVLAYNAADRDLKKYAPNHEKFKKMLPHSANLLNYQELNYQTNPAFAIVYLSLTDEKDLQEILQLEFNDCFDPKI